MVTPRTFQISAYICLSYVAYNVFTISNCPSVDFIRFTVGGYLLRLVYLNTESYCVHIIAVAFSNRRSLTFLVNNFINNDDLTGLVQ